MITRFIGDVHGKYSRYKEIIRDSVPSIQIGDMGVGFRHERGGRYGEFMENPPYDKMASGNHRFIRGNHDNPGVCAQHSQWIPDGTIEGDVMYIGGALSIDRAWRVPGFTWWDDEELSLDRLNQLVDVYAEARPRIMVTHDCPESLVERMCAIIGSTQKHNDPSRTRQAFESMLCHHAPELWIYGHWHMPMDKVIGKTRFVCLAELEYKDLDI